MLRKKEESIVGRKIGAKCLLRASPGAGERTCLEASVMDCWWVGAVSKFMKERQVPCDPGVRRGGRSQCCHCLF